jgi:starch-binding outer membrane protein, SusD/RagB family
VLDNYPTFVREATVSGATTRRYNRVGEEFWQGRITVDHSYRDLSLDGVPDHRIESFDARLGHDAATRVWMATKYGPELSTALRETPLPIATWREAHLIIAEVEGGNEAVERINVLRDHHGLPRYEPAGASDAEILAQVIEERQRELFLEGHHLNDLRRFELPFLPAPGESYRQGGIYGTNTCFMLPLLERVNNPNVN